MLCVSKVLVKENKDINRFQFCFFFNYPQEKKCGQNSLTLAHIFPLNYISPSHPYKPEHVAILHRFPAVITF